MQLPLLILLVCSFSPGPAQGAEIAGVKLFLSVDKLSYAPREPIGLILRVVNESPKPIRLTFRNSQRFDLILEDGQDRQVWRWSAGRVFAQVLGEEVLKPSGGELLFRGTAQGNFPPGTYTVLGTIPALEGTLSARAVVTVR